MRSATVLAAVLAAVLSVYLEARPAAPTAVAVRAPASYAVPSGAQVSTTAELERAVARAGVIVLADGTYAPSSPLRVA